MIYMYSMLAISCGIYAAENNQQKLRQELYARQTELDEKNTAIKDWQESIGKLEDLRKEFDQLVQETNNLRNKRDDLKQRIDVFKSSLTDQERWAKQRLDKKQSESGRYQTEIEAKKDAEKKRIENASKHQLKSKLVWVAAFTTTLVTSVGLGAWLTATGRMDGVLRWVSGK